MIEADRLLRDSAEVTTICSAMTKRGILAASECGAVPRGEITYFTSHDTNIPIADAGLALESSVVITDTRAIERAGVRVDIDHPVRGDLVITLVAPNGKEIVLKQSLDVDRTPGVHTTFDATDATGFTGWPNCASCSAAL